MMDTEALKNLAKAAQIFTPGAPVSSRALFSGRKEEMQRALEAIFAPGRHPIIYGQRGVGKTSLANIIRAVIDDLLAVKVSCDGADTFETIWYRLLEHATVDFKARAFGFAQGDATQTVSLSSLVTTPPTAASISHLLARVNPLSVFIMDEFDKVTDVAAKNATADLIKIVSDTSSQVTLIIVGVADSISELIGAHPSIERNLVQIGLPTMSDDELRHIMDTGFGALGLTVSPELVAAIPLMCGGFPHYAHLIGLGIAKACAFNHTTEVTQELFDVGCGFAVEDAIERYRDAHAKATRTTQASRYPLILCGCGLASHTDDGVFRATDVVDAVRDYFGVDLTVQAVVPALGEFVSDTRGHVLSGVPVRQRQCYRFSDPMMRPYLRLKARELRRAMTRLSA